MKSIYEPTLLTQIPLTLMQQIAMNKHQSPRFNFLQHILLLRIPFSIHHLIPFQTPRPPLSLNLHKLRPLPIPLPHKPLPHLRPPMTPRLKAQTPIPPRRILKRNPKPDRTRRVRVQKRTILMRGHPASDLRLLADNHTLQHPRIAEAELARYGGVQGRQGGGAERRRERVQVVAYLVDCFFFGFRELGGCGGGGGGEGGFFEEKADFVAGG